MTQWCRSVIRAMALCHRASEVRQVFGEGGVALLDKDGLEGVYVDVARLMGIVNLEYYRVEMSQLIIHQQFV